MAIFIGDLQQQELN